MAAAIALRSQSEPTVPAQDARALIRAPMPNHHPAQLEAMRGGRFGVLAFTLGAVGTGLRLLQQAVVGPVEAQSVGEVLLLEGKQALVIGVLLPGDERRLLPDQRGKEPQPVALAIEDLHRQHAR
jgi:hypothetical protein